MRQFKRYAIYYLPPRGALYDFGSAWLGWDVIDGVPVPHPDLPLPVADLTEAPRKYGFHGTIKPPFRLRDGAELDDLFDAFESAVRGLTPITLDGLAVAQLGQFLALRPQGDVAPLADITSHMVRTLDPFRAPLSEAEVQRRASVGLTTRQMALLERWGYPYVMEEFRFHLTLTGRLPLDGAEEVHATLDHLITPLLSTPWTIDSLCLCGEDQDGMFHLIHREMLSSSSA